MGHGYRDDPRPNVVRSMRDRRGDPDATADVTRRGGLRGRAAGSGVPRAGVGHRDPGRRGRRRHPRRDAVAPRRPRPGRALPRPRAGAGADPPRRRRRRVRGARGPLDADPRGDARASHADRPVKIVYNREESFVGHIHRHPARIWAEHRATREGRLVAVRMRILVDGGAYASSSTAVISNACSFAVGPYAVDNVLIDGLAVYTNNPPCGAMRGFGAVQTCFAAEAQMDRLAAALDIDPVELRLLNALETGGTLATGQVVTGSLPTREVIRRAAALRAARAGGAAARRRSACPAARGTRRAARESGGGSGSPSASRTSATRRASTTTAPRASCWPRTARPRCTAQRPRWARA